MPGPVPSPASKRQRRNRTSTAATLEAAPAARAELPSHRVSAITCEACPLPAWRHNRAGFEDPRRNEPIEPHDYIPRELGWRAGTRKWWDTIWASPIADEWVDADVPGLLALAVLVDEYWTTGDARIHAEMRQASREFGLSPLSRRQLQWEVKKVTAATRPPVAVGPARRPRSILAVLEGKTG